MSNRRWLRQPRVGERGNALFLVAASMVVILGLSALAIDLVSFYVARSEAQRSADAAALAGATYWSRSGCTSTTSGCSGFQTGAMNAAIDVGNQNLVGGVNPNIQSSDFAWNYSPITDPRITVTVQRTAARGNAVPTFFGRVLGFTTVDISATAAAETYNPGTGSGPAVGSICVKPWLMPNCDPTHTSPQNTLCSGTQAYIINPNQTIANPSILGTLLTIKPGSPGQAITSSQFFPVILPPGTAPAECPTCSSGGGSGGAALYRQNIECCNTRTISCGSITLQPETGNVVGPTRQGVDCLIHESNNGTGQDILNTNTSPFTFTGGSNNPNPALRGQPITSSDSIVTAPIYDGAQLCPGKSCPASVTANIVGFMQLFIKDETNPQGTVDAYILNISTCGGGSGGGSGGGGSGGGGGTVVTGGGLLPVPVRLVHP